MKAQRAGYVAIGICLLLSGLGGVASAEDDAFSAAEKRALAAFDTSESVETEINQLKLSAKLGVRFTEARIKYEEHPSVNDNDTDGDWHAWMTRGDLLASIYHETDSGNNLGVEIDFGLFRTTTEEEDDWRVVDQENDTNFRGWELKLGLGYIQVLNEPWKIKHILSYGRRVIEFERNHFVLTNETEIDERYTIDYLEYNPQLILEGKQEWLFSFNPRVAYVLRGETDSDLFDGTIEAEEGVILGADAKVGYQFTESVAGYIGALGEWQYLEGDTAEGGNVEWPDNDLFTYGLMIGVTFTL